MNLLGNGLAAADHDEEALLVKEAELSMLQRLGVSEGAILTVQTNLACTYYNLGRFNEASSMERAVYSGESKLYGEENERTLVTANN